GVRLDPFFQQLVDESRIEIDSLLVDRAGAFGMNAAPGDAEPVSVCAELGHDADVVLVAPVVVAGDVAGLVEPGVAGSVGEAVPDTSSSAISGRGAFDLVGGGRGSPNEIVGEFVARAHLGLRAFI